MKRRFLLMAIVSILMIFAFVSCSNEVAPEDKLGMITFGNNSRDPITYSVDYSAEVENLFWYYKATKADNGAYKTGDTNGELQLVVETSGKSGDDAKKGLEGKTLSSGGFSYGYWNIELYGYAAEADVSNGAQTSGNGHDPKFKATLTDLLVAADKTYATAKIEVADGLDTTITFGSIVFTDSKFDITDANKDTFKLEVIDNKGTVTVTTTGDSDVTVDTASHKITYSNLTYKLNDNTDITGAHEMKFTLTQTLTSTGSKKTTDVTVATYTLKFGVQKGTETNIYGDMSKNDSTSIVIIDKTEMIQSLPPVVLNKVLKLNEDTVTQKEGDSVKTGTVSEATTINYGDCRITYPEGAVVTTSDNKLSTDGTTTDTTVGMEYKGKASEYTGDQGTIVLGDSDTGECYELTLDAAKGTKSTSDEGDGTTTANDKLITIVKKVGANREFTAVYHSGKALDKYSKLPDKADNNGKTRTTAESYAYDPKTGELTLRLFHASEIYLVAKEYVAEVNDTKYYSFKDAVAAADNSTLTLLRNITLSEEITASKSFTLDLDGKTITVSGDGAVKLGEGITVTIKNANNSQKDFTDAEARIGDVHYLTFKAAYDKAVSSNVITLLKDVSGVEAFKVESGKTLTLDLNNKKMIFKDNLDVAITNEGTLTICNGTISYIGTVPATTASSIKVINNSGTLKTEKLTVEAEVKAACNITGDFTSIMSNSSSCPLVAVVMNTGTAAFDNSKLTLSATLSGSPISGSTFAGAKPIVIYQSGAEAKTEIKNSSTIKVTSGVPGGLDGLYVVNSSATVSDSTITATNSSFGWTRPVFVESSSSSAAAGITITNSEIKSTDNLEQNTINTALNGTGLSLNASDNRVYGLKVRGNAVINVDNNTTVNVTVKENGGTKISYAGEFGTVDSTKNVCGKILDSTTGESITVGSSDYSSFATAMTYAPVNSTVKLDSDVELSKSIYLSKSVTVDMNNKKLTVKNIGSDYNAFYLKASESAYMVTFKNGTIQTDSNNASIINHAFSVNNNAVLNLDNIDIDVKAYTCVYLVMQANPATLNVTNNSNLYNSYGYGIGTNATNADKTHVNLTIKDSKINDVTGKGVGETGLMVNVPCTVLIENSTIAGDCHGVIFRSTDTSSSVEVKNSTIRSVSLKKYGYVWDGGNKAPQAALTIGNSSGKDGGYPRGTKVVLTDVTLECGNTTNGKHLWVEQATDKHKTEVSGTVKVGNGVTLVHNDNINGATVSDLKCNGNLIWATNP